MKDIYLLSLRQKIIKQKKFVIFYIVFYSVIILGFCCFAYRQEVIWKVFKGCALDGSLVWCMEKASLAGCITPLAFIFILRIMKDDFIPGFVMKHKSRRTIWLEHFFQSYIICFIFVLYAMIVSFFIAWTFEGSLFNLGDKTSLFYFSLERFGSYKNIPQMIALALVINSSEVFVVAAFGLLIYWKFDKSIIPAFIVIIYTTSESFVSAGKLWTYGNLLFDKLLIKSFYWELQIQEYTVRSLLKVLICISALYLISYIVVEKKQFYE